VTEFETARLLYETLQNLPERTAEVIKLTLDGFRQEEIAERMGIAVSSVKTLKSSGIGKLREIMNRDGTDALHSGN
jgi:RNA polymerase sigma-70 factor (ECF subfamily)